MHSEQPKLYTVLAVLSAMGLMGLAVLSAIGLMGFIDFGLWSFGHSEYNRVNGVLAVLSAIGLMGFIQFWLF